MGVQFSYKLLVVVLVNEVLNLLKIVSFYNFANSFHFFYIFLFNRLTIDPDVFEDVLTYLSLSVCVCRV